MFKQSKISTFQVDSTLTVFHFCLANRPNPGKCLTKSPLHLPYGNTQGQETQYFQTSCTIACWLQRDSQGVCASPVSVPCHSKGYTCHGDRGFVYVVGFSSFKAFWCPVVRPSPLDRKHVYPVNTQKKSQTNKEWEYVYPCSGTCIKQAFTDMNAD